MNKLQQPINIPIKTEWLQSGYFVYVVVIKHKEKGMPFLYVGQTGDNHHPTARGPLFRISGHFVKTPSSDQNQIIKGFRNSVFRGENITDEQLESALINSEINYYFWKISDYVFNAKEEKRVFKRKETQFIEHWLIWKFQQNKKIKLFNGAVTKEISDTNKKFFKNIEIVNLKKQAESIFEYFNGVGI